MLHFCSARLDPYMGEIFVARLGATTTGQHLRNAGRATINFVFRQDQDQEPAYSEIISQRRATS